MKPLGVGVKAVTIRPRTAMAAPVPASARPTLVAVRVWLPVVASVAVKTPLPPARVVLGGSAAALSLLVKWTVPA